MPTILVVEDDETLRVVLADNLQEEGYQVIEADCGEVAEAAIASHPIDLIVLDIMLPDTDGYALCRSFRASGVTAMILMLTARTLEEDLIRGLDAGADDYLVKPYRIRELLARIRALFRRSAEHASAVPKHASQANSVREQLTCGEFTINLESHEVHDSSGRRLQLTRTEFDLLCHLVQNQGRAFSREEILTAVWGADVVIDDRTVDNFISSLKKKLRWTAKSAFHIRTIRGIGYRMDLL